MPVATRQLLACKVPRHLDEAEFSHVFLGIGTVKATTEDVELLSTDGGVLKVYLIFGVVIPSRYTLGMGLPGKCFTPVVYSMYGKLLWKQW